MLSWNDPLVLFVHQRRRYEKIGGRPIAGNGNVVDNCDSKQGFDIYIMRMGFEGIPKEDHKVYLPFRDMRADLLVAT